MNEATTTLTRAGVWAVKAALQAAFEAGHQSRLTNLEQEIA